MHRIARANRASERVTRQTLRGISIGAGGIVAALIVAAAASGCRQQPSQREVDVAVVDSVLAELGGTSMARLERGQRWRMISSVGTGLPPAGFTADDLPEPGARGAGLLQVYCIQCHWLPTPQMHTAAEWELLLPRMYLRARTLRDRMGGPLTTGMVGDVVMKGLTTAELPTAEQQDSLLAYLERNALRAARTAELTAGPGRDLYMEKCSICHQAPAPSAHTAAGWDLVLQRMNDNMVQVGVEPLTGGELDQIAAYLRQRAAR